MKDENKKKLVEAINFKFPNNNVFEIYYNIGRALPFTVQRFLDGRMSDWYQSQYVQVIKVLPHGKYGKYGKAYGFYFCHKKELTVLMTRCYVGVKRMIQNRKRFPNQVVVLGN